MKVTIEVDGRAAGRAGAADGAAAIREAITEKGNANIIVATGASQFALLEALVAEPGIDWSKITGFHLDEYIDLPIMHPASFRKYLKESLVDLAPLGAFHYVDGNADDPQAECARLGALISQHPIDAAFVGIGENGHLAFNDPPADFETEEPYLVVTLDEACRAQQHGEGWFETFDDVPKQAISMSVKQIMKAAKIFCPVPDERKARAVAASIEGPVTPDVPASILQQHEDAVVYLDPNSASLLKK